MNSASEKICWATTQKLNQPGKGILAADESIPTIGKRLSEVGVDANENSRRSYRELLIGCPSIEQYLSGIILHEETLYQSMQDGQSFCSFLQSKGISIGIKVDQGLTNLPYSSEKVTRGLDTLNQRLEQYYQQGARFAKWRCVYKITDQTPSYHLMHLNAQTLAHYAKLCQINSIVPIIEPEILIEGDHSIDKTKIISHTILESVFSACEDFKVNLPHAILKPSMITSGRQSPQWPDTPKEVAEATFEVFNQIVPKHLAGINFLSGGQSPQQASDNLYAIQCQENLPWNVSFSFARAIQEPCLRLWAGEPACVDEARSELIVRLKANCRYWLTQNETIS